MTVEKLAAECERLIFDWRRQAGLVSQAVSSRVRRQCARDLAAALLAAQDAPAQPWREFAATHDEPNVEPIKHEELPRHQPAHPVHPEPLDEAWAEAEAAITPFKDLTLRQQYDGRYLAYSLVRRDLGGASGDSPAAALHALAAKLREASEPEGAKE